MPLCDLCQSVDVLDIPKLSPDYKVHTVTRRDYPCLVQISSQPLRDLWKNKQDRPKDQEPVGLPFHQSLEGLENAAADDCAICKTVQRDVAQFQSDFSGAKKEPGIRAERGGGPDWKMCLVRGVNDTGGFMVVSVDTKYWCQVWVVAAVGLCADYGDPLAAVVRGRKTLSSSPHTLAHALNWVRDCEKQRTDRRCHVDTAPLPARVLDIRDSTPHRVALYAPAEGELGRYAALSYVWGDSSPFATTRANIEANKRGIDTDQLPKTFQDAILIAREMGIGYLWIDSLCICQDDSEDWSRETSRMASVYSNAYIMLSATGSPSSTSGLSIFSPSRPAPIYSPFEYTTTDGIKGTLHAFSSSRETAAKPSWAGNNAMLKTEPLSQRGWALQERWLAPRVLHFGTEQMFFECYCSFLSEQGFYLPGRFDTLFPTTSHTFPSHTHPSSPDKPIPDNPTLHWHAVLDAYSRRSLTKPSDKLVALSGLARTYASLLPSPTTYLAGHWSPTLLQDLIWQAVGTTTAPAVYRAPSWSWAAIDGPFGLFSPNSGVGWDKGEWTALAKIHATSVTLKSAQNPFGEVTDGYIDISAPLERLYPAAEQREGEGDVFPNRQKGAVAQTKEKLEGDMEPTCGLRYCGGM
ncbi:uncharacterized protein J4E79_002560 [Alternaria viburni]|uniref:uncharacterized protein n=1 Tax=Alternaria viburni TaxID=566460 RepID=UPI0020C433E8|nr:uncharacterized protein J4E79_002560 [Alternaria viburni]KAI4666521.1 hypothetical protein J4E79_002560 [Alternaria viburni]